MRIVEIRESSVDIKSPIRNAYVNFEKMTASIVAIVSDVVRDGKPLIGYGFNSNGRYSVSSLIKERFHPRLLEVDSDKILDSDGFIDPMLAWDVMMQNEKPGGHGERAVAVGVLDMALWDLTSKIQEIPLHKLISNRFNDGVSDTKVFVYAAGGYYSPEKTIKDLQDEIRNFLREGYSLVKIKVGGAGIKEDMRRIEAVLEVVGDGQSLAIDANGRFDAEQALMFAEKIKQYNLRWFEEPCDPLDFESQAALSKKYSGSMATGENLFSFQDARNLLRFGDLRPDRDILQFDCALSYGLPEYLKILNFANSAGWSRRSFIPHGGHQMSLNMAAGLGLGGNESYPALFPPFNGFADDSKIKDGFIGVQDIPGVGFEGKKLLIDLLRKELT
jgi:L-alanine-DL-glutamate epimerase-like enolase superfamily enzyme